MEGVAKIDAALLEAVVSGASTPTAPTAAVAGVVVDGCTVFLCGAGSADDGVACSSEEGAATTVFVTASISKTFLAALALQCAERGELDLDADINVTLSRGGEEGTPGPVGNPHFSQSQRVTARHLLTHSSGLIDDETNLEYGSPYRWPVGATSTVSLVEYVQRELARDAHSANTKWAKTPPGSAPYHYSNAGFALLGLVIERAAGTPLPVLARKRLFHPLGMYSTSYFLTELREEREEWMETLHFAAPRGQPEPQGHYEVAEYPAAQVRSTVADLCRWLSFLTRPDLTRQAQTDSQPKAQLELLVEPALRRVEPDHVLSAESIDLMLPSTGKGALAWWGMDAQYSEKRPGQFEHGGFMQGIRTHIYLWPRSPSARQACGCVVLLNGEANYEHIVDAIKQLPQVSKI